MKFKIFVLAALILFSITAIAQDVIVFKDGTEIKGIVKAIAGKRVAIERADNGEIEKYRSKKIDYFTSSLKDVQIEYRLRDIKGINYGFSGLVISGKVNLYIIHVPHSASVDGIMDMWALQRGDEKVAKKLNRDSMVTPLKKILSKYFKDCPEAIKRIKAKKYGYDNLYKLVYFYNKECK